MFVVASYQEMMTDQKQSSKQFSFRYPEEFWERAQIAAIQKRVTMREAAIRGIAQFLDIDPPAGLADAEEE